MEFLLHTDEAARKRWAVAAPSIVPVFVHPLYEYLRRNRSEDDRVLVITTPRGLARYQKSYASMPRVSMEAYPEQLRRVAEKSTYAIVFEEHDRMEMLREHLPGIPWDQALVVPTRVGNAAPYEIEAVPGENPWYPRVVEAFSQIGRAKEFVVYGGGFLPAPEFACAGTVLLFLLGLEDQGMIKKARAGATAVLRA